MVYWSNLKKNSYNPECICQMSGASFAELKIIHDFKKIIMENVKADYGTSMYMSGSEFHWHGHIVIYFAIGYK